MTIESRLKEIEDLRLDNERLKTEQKTQKRGMRACSFYILLFLARMSL